MAQKISQGNIFGRIGTGFGQGLAEQLPKEMDRNRLASGLSDFERDHQNLTPIQQLTRLSAIPGVTPQMIQSFGELAKQNNLRNAYGRGNQQQGGISSTQIDQQGNQYQDLPKMRSLVSQHPLEKNQQQSKNVHPNEQGQPQIVNENPLNDRTLTRPPWTPQQRDSRVMQYINQGFLGDQAQSLAADDEARDLAEPGALQKRYSELEEKQNKARTELKRHLETKLQKTGDNLFKDLTGENLINLERGMERDLRTNPNATIQDVANDWSNRALELARTKNSFNKTVSKIGLSSFIKGEENLKKLREYQSIFNKSGNSEEYYNLLQSEVGLSPQAAADIAYPPNKNIKNFISNYKPSPQPHLRESYARHAAAELEKNLTTDDSFLTAAWELRNKEPDFDQQAFFDQLSEDKDLIRMNERQRRELAEGTSDMLPNWGDLLIFPIWRR